ncbi:MAG: ADP-ribosylation factor-like protein [Promethearchaeota archaeon]
MNSPKKVAKILIMGLDNSGKTSILLSLQKEVNLLSYYSLKPTPGINIVTIEKQDTRFHIWEFGGQEQFREDYLQNLGKYIQKANKFIYVIDVQDIDRYEIALQYFAALLKLIKNEDRKTIQLSIFLHKFDPGLEENKKFSFKTISQKLINKISDIIPSSVSYNIFKTTIYTVFEKTLLESVSDEFFSLL